MLGDGVEVIKDVTYWPDVIKDVWEWPWGHIRCLTMALGHNDVWQWPSGHKRCLGMALGA